MDRSASNARRLQRGLPVLALGLVVGTTGCPQPPEAELCPQAAPGELVVTELRGPQADSLDNVGHFVELYNASDTELDLRGLVLVLRSGTGETDRILVRAPELLVAPRAYVVLGHHRPERQPAFVDYSFISDYGRVSEGERVAQELPSAGILELRACGELVDEVVFDGLPDAGTWSFDGALEPDAEANDDSTAWCPDQAMPAGPQLYIGLPGTPQQPNPPCP